MHMKHVTLMVKNLEKSIEFYETMTGLTISRRFHAGPGELAFLTNGNGETEIELVCMPQGQKFEGKGMFICFETDKLEEMHKLARDRGLNPSEIQDPGDQTRYFYMYDPDGVSVQLRFFPEGY
ncbi:VOC family protein [Anaerobium acetethylicum]|uniref:Lactoylglutathione lyase n=1 Tax=Anaerobium acetethylicum TaxID=1619234 RepID=A0A1D3TT11_9FIRM|nr:VOC family protein [Anaerobium acetethylicum]SCP97054.1 lactoylglutathione lyase [Anaerobium acetethylicum]